MIEGEGILNQSYIKVFALLVLLYFSRSSDMLPEAAIRAVDFLYFIVLYIFVKDLNVRVLIVCCYLARNIFNALNYVSYAFTELVYEAHIYIFDAGLLITILGFAMSQLYVTRYRILIMHYFGRITGVDTSHYFPTYADRFFIRFFKLETAFICLFIFYFLYTVFFLPDVHVNGTDGAKKEYRDSFKLFLTYWDYWGLIVELLFIAAIVDSVNNRFKKHLNL